MRTRIAQTLVAAAPLALALTPAAQGATTLSANASDLVAAMAHDPQVIVSASFVTRPNTGTPTGTADSYGPNVNPTEGATMAVLSTGEARVLSDPGYVAGRRNNWAGSDVRDAFDVTILRVVLAVPANANCLALDFDFFSEDFGPPSSDAAGFLDAFLAELDPDPASPWSAPHGTPTTPPDDFAVDTIGRVIDANQVQPGGGYNGNSLMFNAQGTGYLGALGFATAQTPVSPGSHTLELSILDRGDGDYDSGVLLDALRVFRTVPGGCESGLSFSPGVVPPVVTLGAPADGSTSTDSTPDLSGTTTALDNTVSVKLYSGGDASGAPVQTLTGSGSGGNWQATAATLEPGTYSAQASAADGAGNEGLSSVHAFTVLAPPGGPGPSPGGGEPPPVVGATNGDDLLNGTPGVDLICGLFGNDTINGLAGNDTLYGDACSSKAGVAQDGNDRMNGGAGNDRLYGAGGADVLSGASGNDSLVGGKGKNSYSGGAGNDTISAANGVKERINCGAGKKDKVTADRKDKVRGCEKVRRRGR